MNSAKLHRTREYDGHGDVAAALDLVVVFTTPELTRRAMRAAEQLGEGLDSTIRLVRIEVVPFPQDRDRPAVSLPFLRAQMEEISSSLPVQAELILSRDADADLIGCLSDTSILVLASPKRMWLTAIERLAKRLRREGSRVVVVYA